MSRQIHTGGQIDMSGGALARARSDTRTVVWFCAAVAVALLALVVLAPLIEMVADLVVVSDEPGPTAT